MRRLEVIGCESSQGKSRLLRGWTELRNDVIGGHLKDDYLTCGPSEWSNSLFIPIVFSVCDMNRRQILPIQPVARNLPGTLSWRRLHSTVEPSSFGRIGRVDRSSYLCNRGFGSGKSQTTAHHSADTDGRRWSRADGNPTGGAKRNLFFQHSGIKKRKEIKTFCASPFAFSSRAKPSNLIATTRIRSFLCSEIAFGWRHGQ